MPRREDASFGRVGSWLYNHTRKINKIATLTDIQKLRLEVGDVDVSFPILDDTSYEYFLEKHSNNLNRAGLDAARAILFQLSTRNSETVDVFSVKNTSAESYRQALLLYIKDPNLNPLYKNLKGYVGGVSISDMDANNANLDNNIIQSPSDSGELVNTSFFTYTWRS